VMVTGRIGITDLKNPTPIADVDFYSFEGKEGDLVTLDIDGGMKGMLATERHVDTYIAIFKAGLQPGSWERFAHNNDVTTADDGSRREDGGLRDARIDNPPVRLPKDGTYIVGVSSNPRFFDLDARVTDTVVTGSRAPFPNGSYTLIISGVTPQDRTLYVSIDIKPGNKEKAAPLNPKAKGVIRIALLSHAAKDSAPEFKALEVKRESITFGSTGDEKSLLRCDKDGADVDRNGLPDLVCHFDNEAAKFEGHELMGKMKGETADGQRFEGAGDLKVVPHTGGH
jgi:Bacterial pre-peptidase C-terminal domain